MRVRFTSSATRQLNAILNHIAADNMDAARAVSSRVEAITAMLAENPKLGRKLSASRLRRFPVKPYPYLIYYEVTADVVKIVRMRHAARFRRAFQEPQQAFAR
jgi:toxin ParE1/3/4